MAIRIRAALWGWAFVCSLIAFTPNAWGQAKSDAARSQEFVESRSPIRDGGIVVSRSVAGLPMETRTVAGTRPPVPLSPTLPGIPPAGASATGTRPPTGTPPTGTVPGYVYPTVNPNGNTAPVAGLPPAGSYPYPAAGSAAPVTGYARTPEQAVALKNMPPGTYSGTGIFNRPTTYTDGQPMRNFFRYLCPH